MPSPVVLCVDPVPDDRRQVRRAVTRTRPDVAVREAGSAAEAMDHLQRSCVDCVVAEYELPDSDGLPFVERVGAEAMGVPVVFYTAHGSERIASDAVAVGVAGYVPKSAGVNVLVDRVDESLHLGEADVAVRSESPPDDRHASFVQQAPVGVVEWNLDFTVRYWNPAAERIFGYDAGDARGRHAKELLIPDADEWAITRGWRRLITGNAPSRRVNQNVRADGTRIICEWYNEPLVRDGEVVGALSFVRDVTERERRKKYRGVVNRILRHDLRNEMNVVIGCAESLAADAPSDEAERHANVIRERATALVDLVNGARAVEDVLDAGDSIEEYDVVDLVERLVSSLDDEYPAASFDVSTDDDPRVRVHETFPTAVEELLTNAVEHNDGEEATVSVDVEPDGESVTLVVTDDGPGIPAAERASVDDHRHTTQLSHGSGIGLWTADWIVDRSGGTIAIEDVDPTGTRVRVTVPAADESE